MEAILYRILTLCLVVLPLLSCQKIEETQLSNKKINAESNLIINTLPAYRGIYINDFEFILGNISKEDSLLNWCKKRKFNAISLYDLGTIFDNPANTIPLANFIKKARKKYNFSVAAVRGGNNSLTQTHQFNIGQTDLLKRFNVFNLESEWWNNEVSWPTYIGYLGTLDSLTTISSPAIIAEEYIGWFRNPLGMDSIMAAELVKKSDRILFHDYQSAPSLGYCQSRLEYIGKAAAAQNKTIDIVVLFSSEPTFMYNYFSITGLNKSFEQAFYTFKNQYTTTSFPGKSNLKLVGYQIFTQTTSRQARP